MGTSTETIANATPTGGSTGTDLNGHAVINACNKLNEYLDPIREASPDDTWEEIVEKAYNSRTQLSAFGFYNTSSMDYDWDKDEGGAFLYLTYGVGCSMVEIDCLTGDHQVLRTDIVMDLGESINPAIDIGQIEGGFMQGYGLFVMEQLIHSPDGTLLTKGPGAYKIPSFNDVPSQFNVCLLRGVSNPRAVYSSKAVGEPPLFLAASVFFAKMQSAVLVETLGQHLTFIWTPQLLRKEFALDVKTASYTMFLNCLKKAVIDLGEFK